MFDIEYQFNFCETLPKSCNGQVASAIEYLDIYDQPTDTCEVLGSPQGAANNMHISLIDDANPNKGLLVGMLGGSICEGSDTPALNGKPRKAFFRLECGENEDK